MKGRQPKQSGPRFSYTLHGVTWTLIMAAATYAIYLLHRRHILSEEQLMLSTFILAPLCAFLLCVQGQDL